MFGEILIYLIFFVCGIKFVLILTSFICISFRVWCKLWVHGVVNKNILCNVMSSFLWLPKPFLAIHLRKKIYSYSQKHIYTIHQLLILGIDSYSLKKKSHLILLTKKYIHYSLNFVPFIHSHWPKTFCVMSCRHFSGYQNHFLLFT